MFTRFALIVSLLLLVLSSAWSGWPSSGQPYPISGGPSTALLWQFCGPSGTDVTGACNATGSVGLSSAALGDRRTFVSKFIAGGSTPIANQPGGAAHLQFVFNAMPGGTTLFTDAWIGQGESGSGACGSYTSVGFCSWNFNSAPTQITFNGGNAGNIATAGRFSSDNIAYSINPSLPTLLAISASSTSWRNWELPVGSPSVIATPNPNALIAPFNTYFMTATTFTAQLSSAVCGAGFRLNVTAVAAGKLAIGQQLHGSGIPISGVYIISFGTGTGLTGTYCVDTNLTVGSEAMTSTEARTIYKASGTTTQNNGNAYAQPGSGGAGAINFLHSITAVP